MPVELPIDQTASLVTCLSRFATLPKPLPRAFKDLFTMQKFEKSQVVVRVGARWQLFSVILDGTFRLYYIDQDGKEHTKGIFTQGDLLAPCAPAAIQQPVNFAIESFTSSTTLSADYQSVRAFLETEPWGQMLLLSVVETLLDQKVEREYHLLTMDSQQRYEQFVIQYPALARLLPLYIVASFLGMTDVNLSRVRKRMGLTL